MLNIYCNSTCQAEREYICHVIFAEFLGLDYCLQFSDVSNWCIRDKDVGELILPDTFFQTSVGKWLMAESLPVQPLQVFDTQAADVECSLVDSKVPIIYGDLNFHERIQRRDANIKQISLPLDVFGSAFFMLSRYEEAVKPDRDNRDRFPATASLAFQEIFLDRPIVNEYIEILWASMKKLWPQLERKKRTPRTLISCDVDHPYSAGIKSLKKQIRQTGGDLLKRKDFKGALFGAVNYFNAKRGDFSLDQNYSAFDWMMDVNESAGNQVAFYFMAGQTDLKMDGCYSLDEPVIQRLMKKIYERGHEIGLHASYNTYLNQQQTVNEAYRLRQAMELLDIHHDELGGRQHYLRWQTPQTASNWAAAGMDYDSTLTFADHIGFRCGVCYEYPMYDLKNRKQLTVRQRPLIVMEGSLFENKYMGLSHDASSSEIIKQLKSCCHQYNGDFTLLWHNSSLNSNNRSIYVESI